MTTIREAIVWIQETLQKHGIENAVAESQWLMCHVLKVKTAELLLHPDRRIVEEDRHSLVDLAQRRGSGEPLQHILGDVEFCGCSLLVSPDVLIPRPETEWLVETMLELARTPSEVLDIGTGSGAIAIAVASLIPSARVTALDRSPAALRMANANATRNAVSSRLSLILADLHCLPFAPDSFDLIVSNPPYIRAGDIPDLEPEVRNYEPLLALSGGLDGLDCYRSLASQFRSLLKPGGTLAIELPGHPPEPILRLFSEQIDRSPEVRDDWTGKPRLLTVRTST